MTLHTAVGTNWLKIQSIKNVVIDSFSLLKDTHQLLLHGTTVALTIKNGIKGCQFQLFKFEKFTKGLIVTSAQLNALLIAYRMMCKMDVL